jgi:hypothetical protein
MGVIPHRCEKFARPGAEERDLANLPAADTEPRAYHPSEMAERNEGIYRAQ